MENRNCAPQTIRSSHRWHNVPTLVHYGSHPIDINLMLHETIFTATQHCDIVSNGYNIAMLWFAENRRREPSRPLRWVFTYLYNISSEISI